MCVCGSVCVCVWVCMCVCMCAYVWPSDFKIKWLHLSSLKAAFLLLPHSVRCLCGYGCCVCVRACVCVCPVSGVILHIIIRQNSSQPHGTFHTQNTVEKTQFQPIKIVCFGGQWGMGVHSRRVTTETTGPQPFRWLIQDHLLKWCVINVINVIKAHLWPDDFQPIIPSSGLTCAVNTMWTSAEQNDVQCHNYMLCIPEGKKKSKIITEHKKEKGGRRNVKKIIIR